MGLEVEMKIFNGLVVAAFLAVFFFNPVEFVRAQDLAQVTMFDKNNRPITALVDGNRISLGIELAENVSAEMQVDFLLAGVDLPVASCSVPVGKRACQSASFPALGWFWDTDGFSQPQRAVTARGTSGLFEGSLTVSVLPRPVVMVHGFNSDFHAWDSYLGPQGYLAAIGLHGYAVGDGQVEGVLNTGSLSNPTARTNTLAQNAVILGEYIDNVQSATGAEKVDLVVHSMGGMISRYYIDRVMTDVDVAQLVILGTPMAGSDCAALPASLGILLPATLEIQPSYMVGVFNQQIVHRRGVPFYALAGNKLLDAVQSPCTPVPSDLVVTVDSVKAIPMPVEEIDLLHTELTTSSEIFSTFVQPRLQTLPGKFESPADPPAGSSAPVSQQFTRVYTGHVDKGGSQEVTIHIDPNVAVANFALYDTSRSLIVSVVGASGNEIQLDAQKNGFIRVDDPSTLVHLGYGFEQPKPGKWVITMLSTEKTPPQGADFAISAKFEGGAKLTTNLDVTTPQVGQTVNISAMLTADTGAVPLSEAQATVRYPDGSTEMFDMSIVGNSATLTLKPRMMGIYGVAVAVLASTQNQSIIDRAAFLTIDAQPTDSFITANRLIVLGGIIVLVVLIVMLARRRRNQSR